MIKVKANELRVCHPQGNIIIKADRLDIQMTEYISCQQPPVNFLPPMSTWQDN